MNTLFNLGGVTVVCTGITPPGHDLAFIGTVTNARGQTFRWGATPRPFGYSIMIDEHIDGKPLYPRRMRDATTWALGVEVAAALAG